MIELERLHENTWVVMFKSRGRQPGHLAEATAATATASGSSRRPRNFQGMRVLWLFCLLSVDIQSIWERRMPMCTWITASDSTKYFNSMNPMNTVRSSCDGDAFSSDQLLLILSKRFPQDIFGEPRYVVCLSERTICGPIQDNQLFYTRARGLNDQPVAYLEDH